MAKNRHHKVPKSDFQSRFLRSKILKKISLKNTNLGAAFLFSSILCSIKIEWLLFLKFLKHLAFFDSYFWPFNKTHENLQGCPKLVFISYFHNLIYAYVGRRVVKMYKNVLKYIRNIWMVPDNGGLKWIMHAWIACVSYVPTWS